MLVSSSMFGMKEKAEPPKLSEVATPPGRIDKLDPSTSPPIGLSPVPLERAHHHRTASEGAGPETPGNIPWADPYPAYAFTLTDQNRRQVSLKDFSGKVVLLNFIYTHCKTVCPLETRELRKLQESLGPLMGRDVLFLSITIDPKRDTQAVLRQYGERHGVDFRSWRFLTGPEEKIREILEAYHVPVQVEKVPGTPEGSYELGHGSPIYLIDQWGRIRKRTAPTMLARIGRQAIEYLVQEGAGHGQGHEDPESPKATELRVETERRFPEQSPIAFVAGAPRRNEINKYLRNTGEI
jgi:cytochrome oxidase Cu insertion factor (SCO1/SenC/PrrC family)